MPDQIAGWTVEHRGRVTYLYGPERRCVACMLPDGETMRIHVYASHEIPALWRTGSQRRALRGRYAGIHRDDAPGMLEWIAGTIRLGVAHSPVVTR